MHAIKKNLLLFVLQFFCYSHLLAQDNHYGFIQYGSRNSILYNAGISRFEDQAAVVLNPATLTTATTSSFNFNSNAIGFNVISFKDGLGKGYNLVNSNLNILPSMAAGVLKPKKNERDWVLGYALYHSANDKLKFTDRAEERYNIINETESPGEENYLAQYHLDSEMDEFSVVAGVGWNLSKNWSIGLSQTFHYRTQQYRDNFTANVLADRNSGATVNWVGSSYDISGNYNKLLTSTKLGVNGTFNKWNVGVTLASPMLALFGSGDITANINLVNIRLDNDINTPRKNYLANGRFEKLKVSYKSPINAALGVSRQFDKVIVYGALNWYGGIKKYAMMDPGDANFVQPPSTENVLYTSRLLTFWDARKAVINTSLAADWKIKPAFHLLFSARTDNYYSSLGPKDRQGITMVKKKWNNYHYTIGTQQVYKTSEWVIGLRYSRGSRNDYPQPFSFNDPTEDNYFQGERKTGNISSNGVQLLLSYTFKFGGEKK